MSYCRFSNRSDAYVLNLVNQNSITCMSCKLHSTNNFKMDFKTTSDVQSEQAFEMMCHLMDHKRAGHKIPKYTMQRLLNEMV